MQYITLNLSSKNLDCCGSWLVSMKPVVGEMELEELEGEFLQELAYDIQDFLV